MAFRSATVGACARRGITATINKRVSKAFLCFRTSASRLCVLPDFTGNGNEPTAVETQTLECETPQWQVAFQPQGPQLTRCIANTALKKKTLKFEKARPQLHFAKDVL